MSEPLYHVGQDVAACTKQLEIVIPQTKVSEIRWREAGECSHPFTGKIGWFGAGYQYKVADSPWWFMKFCLRPINPDTEYLDTTQDLAAPVDGVSA